MLCLRKAVPSARKVVTLKGRVSASTTTLVASLFAVALGENNIFYGK
jgi:hypothetical protein